jgi:hypothetical protein
MCKARHCLCGTRYIPKVKKGLSCMFNSVLHCYIIDCVLECGEWQCSCATAVQGVWLERGIGRQ